MSLLLYFLQVFTPKSVYSGQNLINAVTNGMMPISAKYFKLPSRRKNNKNNKSAKIIRMTRSDCPTFVFIIPHAPFLFFYSIAYFTISRFQEMLQNFDNF